LYFNSKYRRWMKEQKKLAKIMQDLPGVPTKVEFTDIKKGYQKLPRHHEAGERWIWGRLPMHSSCFGYKDGASH
jgi:hypothetical protein